MSVRERRREPRLGAEALDQLGLADGLGQEDLDPDAALQLKLDPEEDRSKTPARERTFDRESLRTPGGDVELHRGHQFTARAPVR
jgi:hypothetical protein